MLTLMLTLTALAGSAITEAPSTSACTVAEQYEYCYADYPEGVAPAPFAGQCLGGFQAIIEDVCIIADPDLACFAEAVQCAKGFGETRLTPEEEAVVEDTLVSALRGDEPGKTDRDDEDPTYSFPTSPTDPKSYRR